MLTQLLGELLNQDLYSVLKKIRTDTFEKYPGQVLGF